MGSMINRNRASAVALDQNTEKLRKSDARNLPTCWRVLLIVARAFDKKIFENESVFPPIERSAAADATHCRVNRRWGFDLHQRVLCRAMRAVEGIGT
jgi:hypothetical protein